MQNQSDHKRQHIDPLQQPADDKQSKKQQQQSDPQKTELKGFIDPTEDLEPRLEDGTKAPDKANQENGRTGGRQD